jgi:hypothetical protein
MLLRQVLHAVDVGIVQSTAYAAPLAQSIKTVLGVDARIMSSLVSKGIGIASPSSLRDSSYKIRR